MKGYKAPFYTEEELELLMESEIKYPYSDKDATYKGLEHQYELTSKYFQERGVNLEERIDGTSPDKVEQFLKDLRVKLYTWIYNNSKSNRQQLNYMIAVRGIYGYTPYEYRTAFLEAMYYQGVYMLDNGDIASVSGVDLDTMQNMSIDVIRHQNRDMSHEAIGILTQLGLNFYGRYSFIPQGKEW